MREQRVIGGGISVPIPLPHPVGRTFAGEIAETEALARRAETERESVAREVRLEVTTALYAYDGAKAERELFTDERVARAEQTLVSLLQEIDAGRLGVRDAILAQQTLVSVVRASIDARLALCLASVQLAFASGAPLDGGAR